MMIIDVGVAAVVGLTALLLVYPRLANAPLWRAAITPLASIIGSGFLVLGPILDASYGGYAPLAMLVLCGVAYAFGGAIRFNIATLGARLPRGPLVDRLELLASAVLAFAYFVSVAYYLNLFGAFGVSLTGFDDGYWARLLTTAVFILILCVGWTKGFLALERLEQVSVGIKLAIIAGLLFGLAAYFGQSAYAGSLAFAPASVTGWGALALLAGLIVTVQGFETSRYLTQAYDSRLRIRSMKLAQWIATVIYVVYIIMLTYAFDIDPAQLEETAIIALLQVVTPVLPVLLVVAALSAQFSAAIADTSGSGGLIAEVSRNRVPPRLAYAALAGFGLLITWTADIFEIISYASRAFAAYYALQALIACICAARAGARGKAALFAGLVAIALCILVFGRAVE